jgi:peptide/nickel transport system substrate-binding protein
MTTNDNTRRRVLKGLGAAGVAGLAGCSGGQGGDGGDGGNDSDGGGGADGGGGNDTNQTDTGDGGSGGGTPMDDAFTSYGQIEPTQMHYNPFNPQNRVMSVEQTTGQNTPGPVMYESLMQYNRQTGEWTNRILTDFSVDSESVTLELSGDYAWSNGDAVAPEDLAAQYRLGEHVGIQLWTLIDGVSVAGDQTVELALKKQTNPGVIRKEANQRLMVKRGVYSEYLQRYEDASSDDERKAVTQDLTGWAYAAGGDPKPVVNGPYALESATSQQWTLTRREDFPVETNIPKYEYLFMPKTQKRWSAMIGGEIDGGAILAAEKEIQKQFPKSVKKISLPGFGGLCVHVQHDHPVLGKQQVRQAFAYLINREHVSGNVNPRYSPVEALSGLTTSSAKQWLGDQYEQLTAYGLESNEEKAAELMRSAGFSKEGGSWLDTNGEAITFEFKAPPWPGPLGMAQTVGSTLSQFGIKTNMVSMEPTTWSTDLTNGNYTIIADWYGGGPHPYFAFQQLTGSQAKTSNYRLKPTLPPIGQPKQEGSTFDVASNVVGLSQTMERSEAKSIVADLAWYYNQYLPEIPMTQGTVPSYMSDDHWEFPATDDPSMYYMAPISALLRETEEGSNRAKLQAKTE